MSNPADLSKNSIVPFNLPFFSGRELEFIRQAVANWRLSGDGAFTQKCHSLLEKELEVAKALLTTSCTHALEMAALLLDIRPGDEVIVPSFTFVSVANAFVLRGARPVFIDIRRDTLNLDETMLENLITSRTRAIVVVHYAGVGCEMDIINCIAQAHGIPVVEDNAHGLFGRYKDRFLGTLGCLSCQSFHETKNFSCGEGGALLINDSRYIERAEIIREKGTNRNRFFRGLVDKYTWVDIGSSYLPSEILAAFLYAQLTSRSEIQSKRRQVWEHYHERLKDWAGDHGVTLPSIPAECEQPYHMFFLVLPSFELRQALIAHLNDHNIHSVFHYLPLHLSAMGRKLGGEPGDCPVTEDISDRLLRLPFYTELSESDQSRVIAVIKKFTWKTDCR